MMSLRSRLLLWSLVSGPIVVALGGLVVYGLARDRLIEQFDQALYSQLDTLTQATEQEGDMLALVFLDLDLVPLDTLTPPEDTAYVQVWVAGGEPVYRSPSLGGRALPERLGQTGDPEPDWCELPGGRGRAVGLRYMPAEIVYDEMDDDNRDPKDEDWDGEAGWEDGEDREEGDEDHDGPGGVFGSLWDSDLDWALLEAERKRIRETGEYHPILDSPVRLDEHPAEIVLVVARRSDAVDDSLADLRQIIGIVVLLAMGASLAGSVVGVRSSLKPLDKINNDIRGIRPADLSARVATRVPHELSPTVNQINTMLARMDEAFTRERGFSSDVAHELRTPLAGLRMKLDVALLNDEDPDKLRKAVADCQAITAGLEQVVADLLTMARLDSRKARLYDERVDLSAELAKAWQTLEAQVAAKAVAVSREVPEGLSLATDPSLLRVILRNLLGNAVQYVDEGGALAVTVATTDGAMRLDVSNSGCTLTQEQVARAATRFWRGDEARDDTGRHAGLGLSLVASAVEALGGTLALEARPGGVFAAQVELPMA